MGFDVSASDLSCLTSVETEDLPVNGGKLRPLVVEAVRVEGVIVVSLDGLAV